MSYLTLPRLRIGGELVGPQFKIFYNILLMKRNETFMNFPKIYLAKGL